jgi:hypothetical protein
MEHSDFEMLRDRAQLSDEFKALVNSRGYTLFEQHVLEKLYQQAFETFKKVDPEEPAQIIQAQMMGKIIDLIRLEVNKIIDSGDIARQLLSDVEE